MTKKKIEIVPYDPNWPKIFEIDAKEIKNALGDNAIDIYHIGSTSVPGLCAKPTVDIMCVVNNIKETIPILENIGYKYKGEFNVPMKFFFSKRIPNNINLHILSQDNGEITWNLVFRNHLMNNKSVKDEYEKVKLNLVDSNPDGFDVIPNMFSLYTSNKGKIIHKIARDAKFKGERFVIATNPNEIYAYNRFINSNNSDTGNSYNIFKLVLYKNMDIVAASYVEIVDKDLYNIISVSGTNSEFENRITAKIQEWMELHEKAPYYKTYSKRL